MFDRIQLKVKNLNSSKHSYTATLAPWDLHWSTRTTE
jgi:hypothetical protein